MLRQEIFDFLNEDEDLVMDACVRAAASGRLRARPYDGFWAPMDTLKERAALEDLHRSGRSPWALWAPQANRSQRGPMATVEAPRSLRRAWAARAGSLTCEHFISETGPCTW